MHTIGHIVLYNALLIGLNLALVIDEESLTKNLTEPAKRNLTEPAKRNLTEPVKIPETLLMKLDSVKSVPEFLRKFVESREPFLYWLDETADIGLRRASARARKLNPNEISVPYGKPAKCQPELQVVSIQKTVGNVIHWPSCVRVKRCGGCCGGTLKACTPVQVSLFNLTVIEASYDPKIPDYFQKPKEVVFSVEQHTKCACTCRHQANKCGWMQRFDEDNCRCVCRDRIAQCPQHMTWDDFHCACKCREKTECSTGRYFNVQKCKCELFNPIPYTWMMENSTMPSNYEFHRIRSTLKNEDISPHQTL